MTFENVEVIVMLLLKISFYSFSIQNILTKVFDDANENPEISPIEAKQTEEKPAEGENVEKVEVIEQVEEVVTQNTSKSERTVQKPTKSNSNITREEEICNFSLILNKGFHPNLNANLFAVFIKGGSMYYQPLSETLSAFEKQLIENDNDLLKISKFDLDFVTPDQFVNMLNNYSRLHTLKSENMLNKLINFLKDNYAEVRKEKDMKLAHVTFFQIVFPVDEFA